MADPKVAPVEGSIPSTEEVQRILHGKRYDEIKKREKELAESAPKQEPQAPWPTTEDVQRTIAGGVERKEAPASQPEPARAQHKATEAEPTRASYKNRAAKTEE